jgi:hypothetical protein
LPDFSQIQVPGRRTVGGGGAGPSTARDENDPKWIREMLLANPDQVAMLKQQNPRLAEALNNPDEFTKVRHFPCCSVLGGKFLLSDIFNSFKTYKHFLRLILQVSNHCCSFNHIRVLLTHDFYSPSCDLITENDLQMTEQNVIQISKRFSSFGMLNKNYYLLQILREQQAARAERERLRIRMLTADPMDIEAQRLIAQVRTGIH